MKKHRLQLLTLILIGILIYSCEKEDDFIDEAQNTEISKIDNSQGARKLENPYTVENMKKAFENIKTKLNNKQILAKSSSSVSNLEISASHYYVKFKPETEEQEGIIKQDSTMYPSDYPLDWEFTDEYLENRPKLPEGKFPEYYVAIPINKAMPSNVPYEILEELYIPEEDATFNKKTGISNKGYTQKGAISNNEDLLRHLLNEAYSLTGNEDDLLEEPNAETQAQAKWIFGSRWWPSGTLKIWDANAGSTTTRTRVFSHWGYPCEAEPDLEEIPRFLDRRIATRRTQGEEQPCKVAVYRYITNRTDGKYVPLVGAQVLMRQWFTVRQGITDQNGYFKTSSVRGKARYILQWERYHYSIRNGSVFQAETRGPKLKKRAWNHNIKGGDDEYHGMIHTAAHLYYYGSRFGLTSPPTNATLKRQLKIAAREDNDKSSYVKARRIWFGADISLRAWGGASELVFGTTIHELAHAAHREVDGAAYNNIVWDAYTSPCATPPLLECNESLGPTANNNRRLLETWATTVEIAFALDRYKRHFNQPNYEYRKGTTTNSGNKQKQIIEADYNHYTSAGYDMIDNFNQREYFGSDYPIDRVSGYTIKQLEDALRGARSWTQWRDNIKSRYNNSTEEYLDELFNNWPN